MDGFHWFLILELGLYPMYSSRFARWKQKIRVLGVFFFVLAILFRVDDSNGVAYAFLFLSGFISISILLVEVLITRVIDWVRKNRRAYSLQKNGYQE